jgi:hypothetical protein
MICTAGDMSRLRLMWQMGVPAGRHRGGFGIENSRIEGQRRLARDAAAAAQPVLYPSP